MAKSGSSVRRLAGVPTVELRREIESRKRRTDALLRKRARLAAKLRELDERLAELGASSSGEGAPPGGVRFRNEKNLADALAEALDGMELSIREAMEAVQRAGYRTTARNFRVMVNLALTRDKRFKRVRRGVYTAR